MLTENELYTIQETICSMGTTYDHTLTDGELGWLDFVRGRYCIADYLDERIFSSSDDAGNAVQKVRLDDELSAALDADNSGAGKAVMLSDDTDLQAIFFYCYTETE